ncbi:MAG: carbohydrate kinase family protein [Victivallaceae bacterium]|nr:carbohydrate kinase family protein [Victivallaceae bacterium]
MSRIKVSATGCSLADYLYTGIDFTGDAFKKYSSRRKGDGGLNPGHLVFVDDLEKFAGKEFMVILEELTRGKKFDGFNVGGPAIVAAVNAAQLLSGTGAEVDFYGALGQDDTADRILDILSRTPVNISSYRKRPGTSPYTRVLSDPDYHDGKGERTFINNIGACWDYVPAMIGDEFYNADVLFFGATALMPGVHDHLTSMLKRGKENKRVNIVTTVFDFRNEKNKPGKRWPLGESDESFRLMDLLIVDWDEALKISGEKDFKNAARFFMDMGVKSFIVTHGAHDFFVWSNGAFFKECPLTAFPICAAVDAELRAHPEKRGDTTGCGDNFAGGALTSVVKQLLNGRQAGELEISDACAWACASGGFACFTLGGTYFENAPGEKLSKVKPFYEAYLEQIKAN